MSPGARTAARAEPGALRTALAASLPIARPCLPVVR